MPITLRMGENPSEPQPLWVYQVCHFILTFTYYKSLSVIILTFIYSHLLQGLTWHVYCAQNG